eukprot:CAMPEP_0181189438 /NCGR_PEP_ID=MMETSP1096-20121128/11660_1 /TAXON_ID=156174 ORGANISM="Chrysochromulina ericina, Strain CCMP281" /NCGR_SAMPLE_ID=MMETSP1096 /ASSEMBLY_ACC=CAM_ASM_000453 /LENGTH=125 /DNA_ID=CAMNT_0023278587 /DNA_START=130 /DNA_END=506 /DNA_ORIENTATION=+
MASRTTPVDALLHGLVSTHAHHAADWSVDASQTYPKRVEIGGAPQAAPVVVHGLATPAPIAPKLAPASSPAMVIAREQNQATKPCSSSLQTAATSGGSTRGAQTVERPHCRPAACWLSPSARAGC